MLSKVTRHEWWWVMWMTLALWAIGSVPYVVAWATAPEGVHFTGLIFNPIDGYSYLAKMRLGAAGAWRFRLPYSPDPHTGAPVYLFYLLLGHLARVVGLSPIIVYHSARLLGGGWMAVAIYKLAACIGEEVAERRIMFLLSVFGAGLGWVAVLFGWTSSDLQVPEAFPMYAFEVNPHFPVAIGLMAMVVVCAIHLLSARGTVWMWGGGLVVTAALLGVIQPFGLWPSFGGIGVAILVGWLRGRSVPLRTILCLAGSAVVVGVYPLYMLWVLRADPVLAAWQAQNVTPSPPVWDWALSYGLMAVLAVGGSVIAWQRGRWGDGLLLGWVGTTLVGMYLPLTLQRRLSLGLGVPIGILAGLGYWRWVRLWPWGRRRRSLSWLVVGFSALTPVFLLMAAMVAPLPFSYLSDGEWRALEWLRENGRRDAVVLCAPQTGAFIPAWSDQRVVYGHPFETVDAERRQAQVMAFWTGEMDAATRTAFLRESRVRYVFAGPRERAIAGCGARMTGCAWWPAEWERLVVFSNRSGEGNTWVYEVAEER